MTIDSRLRFKLDYFNEWESAASFCHQLAALFPDMFCNFY
jgi:hypothetical protein